MIPAAAAVTAAVLILGAAYVGGRAFRRMPVLPVAPTFRAVGVASVPRDDVVSHRRVPGGHRGDVGAPHAVLVNGVYRSRTAWNELDRQRPLALARGGAR